jgi:putative endonuclease
LAKINKREIGSEGEEIAEKYLLGIGFSVITRNWGVKSGEIDIICRSPDGQLVFVEVKYVKTKTYGDAAWKVGASKLAQIRKVAHQFLIEHEIENEEVRIDVVAITGSTIEYYKNCV